MSKSTSATPASIPRPMPLRTADVSLGGDYEGWSATFRTNLPLKAYDAFASGELERMRAVLPSCVLAWNFVGPDGEPLPQPRDGGIDELGIEELTELVGALNAALDQKTDLPNP